MKITVHTSKSVKPAAYGSASASRDAPASTASVVIPLTVFDEVSHDEYIPCVFFFHPPAPPVVVLEGGLAKMLAECREWTGRLVVIADDAGRGGGNKRAILLNDAGVRLVDASADVALGAAAVMPVGPEVLELHPSCDDAEELVLLQVTRFPCGSFTIGYNVHHSISDGYAITTCLAAGGQAVRGVSCLGPVGGAANMRGRRTSPFLMPRDPPLVEFEHRGVEFKPREEEKNNGGGAADDDVVVETVHFSPEFISRLKSLASPSPTTAAVGERSRSSRPYSTMQCVVAHLWRCVTAARGLGTDEVTTLHIAVNGRGRMTTNPGGVPEGYTGNVVLWAWPATTVRELLDLAALPRIAELISRAVAGVDDRYFRSFVDFASSGAVEREGLVRTATASSEPVARNNIEVDSLIGVPFYSQLDFGTGTPFHYVPTYGTPHPVEGAVYLVPTAAGDGGVVAYVPLYRHAVKTFSGCCYSLPPVPDARL